jgi:hypothetical protein
MQVAVTGETGDAAVGISDFVGTDQQGPAVRLQGSPDRLVLRPNQTGQLHLAGVFTAGAGALSYLPGGRPTATWEFNVEPN